MTGIVVAPGPRQDKIGLMGHYDIRHIRGGIVLARFQGKNLVVEDGENRVAGLVDPDTVLAGPDWMALGSGTTAVSKDQSALISEIANSRTQKTSSTVTNNQLALVFEITATAAWTVREAGIFDTGPGVGGNMFSRFLTQAVDMALDDVLNTTYTLTFTGVD